MFFNLESERQAHKLRLTRGLAKLGPDFCAQICWWCKGTTRHEYESCDVCGPHYGMATGLLVFSQPAPASVVNQVLIAGEDLPADLLDDVECLPNCKRASGRCWLNMPCEAMNKLAANMIMDREQR